MQRASSKEDAHGAGGRRMSSQAGFTRVRVYVRLHNQVISLKDTRT